VVICIDEKTGIQAKSRRHPERPPRPGRLARREFEYVRHGTVSIVAALQVGTGQVIAEPIARNAPATFTGFLHRLGQCHQTEPAGDFCGLLASRRAGEPPGQHPKVLGELGRAEDLELGAYQRDVDGKHVE
jgi:hypothetical protein